MQLYRLSEVSPDGSGLVCRQGRLMASIWIPLLAFIMGGAPVFWWRVGAPWLVWVPCALLALFVVPMLAGDLVSRFRSTNWLLWVRHDGLWINFRSYQDRRSTDTQTVLHVPYGEIASVGRHRETFSTPSSETGRSTTWKVQALDIRLKHTDTTELGEAMSADRRRKPAPVSMMGLIEITSTPSHYPVSVAEPDLLRILWRGGHSNWAAPSLARVIEAIRPFAAIAEPTERRRGDWKNLSDAELDDQILELVQAGSRIEAIKLLTTRQGYSTTEAHQFVKQLTGRV